MSTSTVKLTLTIPEEILKAAKFFSKKHKKSISRMVADYLSLLTSVPFTKNTSQNIHPLVAKMTGVAELPSKYKKLNDKEILEDLREERLLK